MVQKGSWLSISQKNKAYHNLNYPNEIEITIKDKSKAQNKWRGSRLPADKTELNQTNRELNNILKKKKNTDTFELFISNLSCSNYEHSLWRKALRGLTDSTLHLIRCTDGTWLRAVIKKTDVTFGKYLEQICMPHMRLISSRAISHNDVRWCFIKNNIASFKIIFSV